MASTSTAVTPDTQVVIKVAFEGKNRKFRLPLRELNAAALPSKLCSILQITQDARHVTIERFSDSSDSFIVLSSGNPSTYKQLYRAAKAKLKLRLKVTVNKQELDNGTSAAEKPRTEPAVVKPAKIEVIESKPTASAPQPLPEASSTMSEIKTAVSASLPLETTLPSSTSHEDALHSNGWQVFCNSCDKILSDAHFHCSICDHGDYDLCEACVDAGKLCRNEEHWLIKRYIKDGKVVNSTTAILRSCPRSCLPKDRPSQLATVLPATEIAAKLGALAEHKNVELATQLTPRRTCNSCVQVFPVESVITCNDCDDFDLCIPCHTSDKHGHHPGHSFKAAVKGTQLPTEVSARCGPGGHTRHFAVCDGCDKSISGVRHKCLDCPDWDFCNTCFANANVQHPGHRFVPVYAAMQPAYVKSPARHLGIYCDGPLCLGTGNWSYITGVRYKCAICNDTDFCANCEAHPSNKHNPTHPLIKFKTAVRNVSVQTVGQSGTGEAYPEMGDRSPETTASTGTQSAPTVVAMDLPLRGVPPTSSAAKPAVVQEAVKQTFDAHFVRDLVPDGSSIPAGTEFFQSWTMRNSGRNTWPIGCRLVSTGGDDMGAAQDSEGGYILTSLVEPGQEKRFTLKLRAGAHEGRHICYWRLKTADGTAFGHKIWCDIKVIKSLSQVIPSKLESARLAQVAYRKRALEEQERRQRELQQLTQLRAAFQSIGQGSSMSLSTGGDLGSSRVAAALPPSVEEIQAKTNKANKTPAPVSEQPKTKSPSRSALQSKLHQYRTRQQEIHAARKPSVLPPWAIVKTQRELASSTGEAMRMGVREEHELSSAQSLIPPPYMLPSYSNALFEAQGQASSVAPPMANAMLPSMGVFPHAAPEATPLHPGPLMGEDVARNLETGHGLGPVMPALPLQQMGRNLNPYPAPRFLNIPINSSALEDYQIQLMLLEQQNIRRLEMARGTADSMNRASSSKSGKSDAQSLARSQMRKMLLEQQDQSRARRAQVDAEAERPGQVAANNDKIYQSVREIPSLDSSRRTLGSKLGETVAGDEDVYASANASSSSSVKVPKPATVEDVDPATEKEDISSSHMVFPKLEKESPSSSTHLEESAVTVPSTAKSVSNIASAAPSVAAPPSTVDSEITADEFEDAETINVEDASEAAAEDSDEDSGFDTDEYDILDASDEEFVTGGKGGL